MMLELPFGNVSLDVVSGGRLCWGFVLLSAPDRLAVGLGVPSPAPRVRAVIRVLGVREIVQALLIARRPGPRMLRAAMAVDATHSASMVLLATLDPPRRRLAGTSALVSSSFAALSAGAARRAS
jgi:hypothetical protein